MDLGDCCTLFALPEELRKRPEMLTVYQLAMTTAIHLVNISILPPLEYDHSVLAVSLAQLPQYVRLDMLKGCCLRFPAMFALLSNAEAITESEDSLAKLLSSYLKSHTGLACSYPEVKQLKDQIRYQHP